MKILKDIEDLQDKLRNDMSTRMDDADIVEILVVLQDAHKMIHEYKWGLASNE